MSQSIQSNTAMTAEKQRQQNARRRPHYSFKGDEIAALVAKAIGDLVYDQLMTNSQLSNDILAFPHPKLEFNFSLTKFPIGENRRILLQGAFDIPDLEAIPPNATRILNDLPVIVEEKVVEPLATGTIDAQKHADDIDPKLKPATLAKFGKHNPLKTGVKAPISTKEGE